MARGVSQSQWMNRFVDKLNAARPQFRRGSCVDHGCVQRRWRSRSGTAADIYTRDLPAGEQLRNPLTTLRGYFAIQNGRGLDAGFVTVWAARRSRIGADLSTQEVAMPRLTESQWINLFLRRLGSLEPELDILDAMRYAMKTYGDAPDLEPEVAAESYVAELVPGR